MIVETQAREVAEHHLGRPVGTFREIPGGCGHFTFVVDERWIFRFARTEAVAEQDRIEQRVLPLVESSVSFLVPRFDFKGSLNGLPYVGYQLLPGRPLGSGDVPGLVEPSALGGLVYELHSIDISAATVLLGVGGTAGTWEARYRHLRIRAADALVGVLDQGQLDAVEAAFNRFFESSFRFAPVVVHGDLGIGHILVDETTGLVGLLDFEAVTIGDPAIDFVGFIITLGPELCQQVINSYPGAVDDGFWERVLGYWWIGSLYAVLHGVNTNDSSVTESGIEGLGRRLSHLSQLERLTVHIRPYDAPTCASLCADQSRPETRPEVHTQSDVSRILRSLRRRRCSETAPGSAPARSTGPMQRRSPTRR